MTQSCGECHLEQKNSFLANYHGKAAVNLGYDKAAFCTDCHGAHTTISLEDKDVALKTCQRCHFDATPESSTISQPSKFPLLKSSEKGNPIDTVTVISSLSVNSPSEAMILIPA